MSEQKPVVAAEVPTVQPIEGVPVEGLPVYADDQPAQIFVVDRGFASDKIAIEFESPHPRFGDVFATKYYYWAEPGELAWGYERQTIQLRHRER